MASPVETLRHRNRFHADGHGEGSAEQLCEGLAVVVSMAYSDCAKPLSNLRQRSLGGPIDVSCGTIQSH
ncbi:hypothetical protein BN1263430026 [Stenotrophomonas indicatrix]|nr:hypothetical protein BN1263430026 [Stenotrophomonas indicatrix]